MPCHIPAGSGPEALGAGSALGHSNQRQVTPSSFQLNPNREKRDLLATFGPLSRDVSL